ncbi:MAG: polysaccharide deacetylase family protein [Alphaproteobacteria bacterium]|jgi:peptidoglycan/xylan/chitin deacetylase (PgdA/CDA1 family)|nr:polysaccharide deacetylase family protein [Alphaproteobacteria bacterium]
MQDWIRHGTAVIFFLVLLVSVPGGARVALAADHAVILTYGRFGNDPNPTAAIRIEQFDAQLRVLKTEGYQVLALDEIVRRLKAGEELPDRTVAITVDDGHLSFAAQAWPKLKAAGLPVTLFVATATIDSGTGLTWTDLRRMKGEGLAVGNVTHTYPYLPLQGRERIAAEIATASDRIETELGTRPRLFAYPYGIWSAAARAQVEAAGFDAAFGQQSGVADGRADRYTLPRFPMNEATGSPSRFRLTIDALPLAVGDLVPLDPMVTANPPEIGFTLLDPLEQPDRLACFASHLSSPATLEWIGRDRVEIRLAQPFPPGRGRINCTAPGPDGRWRWLGLPILVPTPAAAQTLQ